MRRLAALAVLASCWIVPLHAQDILRQATLDTPAGPFHYVLPEGYCVLEGSSGRTLAAALDRAMPPAPHVLTQRFIPCADQRHVFEDRSWPLMHGYMKIQYNPHPEAPLPQILYWVHQNFWKEAHDSVLAKNVFDREMEAPNPPAAFPEDTSTMVGDLRLAVKDRWPGFMKEALLRTREHGFLRDGFPLGRDSVAVWWGGIEHSTLPRVLAMVSATTVVDGNLVSWVLERPLSGPETFDDLRGDLLPAVVATQHLAAVAASPPAQDPPRAPDPADALPPQQASGVAASRGPALPEFQEVPDPEPPVFQQDLPAPPRNDQGPMVPGPGYHP